jgi:acyl carrier protein
MAETLNPDIVQRVMKCVVDTQHLDPARVAVDSTFQELEIDSLAGINILFAVEQEFNITVPDDEAQKVRTVRELIQGVQKLVEAKPASVK